MNEAPINNSIWFWQGLSAGPRFPPPIILLVKPVVIEILHIKFEVLGYMKVNCIKRTLSLVYVTVKRGENSQKTELCFHYLTIEMNDLGNCRCLEGSRGIPNSCNKEPPCPDKYP